MSRCIVGRLVPRLLLLSLLTSATACTTWRRQDLAPAPASSMPVPGTIRVTMRNGSRLTLRDARMQGDTLRAMLADATQAAGNGTVAVALSDIANVESRKLSGRRTVGLVAGSITAAYLLLMMIALGSLADNIG